MSVWVWGGYMLLLADWRDAGTLKILYTRNKRKARCSPDRHIKTFSIPISWVLAFSAAVSNSLLAIAMAAHHADFSQGVEGRQGPRDT